MSWKLPLNQVGNGCTFIIGSTMADASKTKFKSTQLDLKQHPWLEEILDEIHCTATGESANFSLCIDVEKQSQAYRVTARLRMEPKLECIRSLTPFRNLIETENEALFVRRSDSPVSGEHELSESEMESYEHDGLALLLSDFITDVVFTSLPDFPLCRTDCRGLCSECGCNLNEARDCGHQSARSADEFSCPNISYFQ